MRLRASIMWLAAVVAAMFAVTKAYAQNSLSPLVFDSYEWEFGSLREVDGEVTHIFRFTNTGDVPVVVERVRVDCGCTAADYSREPVMPGGEGQVEVRFDPARLSGAFSKKITVYSGGGSNRNLLTVSGYVVSRPRSVEEDYPFVVGSGVRMQAMYAAFGYVENGQAKSVAVGVANASDRPVRFGLKPAAGTAIVKIAAPETLAAGEQALVTLTYDLTGRGPLYGLLVEKLYVTVDGTVAELPFTVNAIAVDDFSNVGLAEAPRCSVSPVTRDFGEVCGGERLETVVEIRNTGSAPLIVRSVSLRHGTECGLEAGTEVESGATLSVPVSFTVPGDAAGAVSGGMTFVVNDPMRPLREVRITADAVY